MRITPNCIQKNTILRVNYLSLSTNKVSLLKKETIKTIKKNRVDKK